MQKNYHETRWKAFKAKNKKWSVFGSEWFFKSFFNHSILGKNCNVIMFRSQVLFILLRLISEFTSNFKTRGTILAAQSDLG